MNILIAGYPAIFYNNLAREPLPTKSVVVVHKGEYYDEKGKYYRNVIAPGVSTVLICSYCNTQKFVNYNDDMVLSCPNCDAPFVIDIIDEKQEGTRIGDKIIA